MRNSILFVCFLLLSSSAYFGCNKHDEDMMPKSEASNEKDMDPELEAMFAAMEEATEDEASPERIVLPGGQTMKEFADQYFPEIFANNKSTDPGALSEALQTAVEERGPEVTKNAILLALYVQAEKLTSYFEEPLSNGQVKYAYVPSDNENMLMEPGVCKEKYYGLDCSGFVKRVFQAYRIELPRVAEDQAKTDLFKAALVAKFGTKVAKINVTSIELSAGNAITTKSKIMSGDVIGYYDDGGKISHIGFAYKDVNGKLLLFQSNGGPSQSCANNKSKGPTKLIDKGNQDYWLKKKIRVIRFTIDISGEWNLAGRCVAQEEDRLGLTLNFSKATGPNNTFTATGSGIDYDGTTQFEATMTGEYDELNSVIRNCKIEFEFPNHIRVDEMPDIALAGVDETPYINAFCIANCGCDLAVRLKNNSK